MLSSDSGVVTVIKLGTLEGPTKLGQALIYSHTSPHNHHVIVKSGICSLGFWIFTVESGSGCGLCTTWVHTCSVNIWKMKNLNFI